MPEADAALTRAATFNVAQRDRHPLPGHCVGQSPLLITAPARQLRRPQRSNWSLPPRCARPLPRNALRDLADAGSVGNWRCACWPTLAASATRCTALRKAGTPQSAFPTARTRNQWARLLVTARAREFFRIAKQPHVALADTAEGPLVALGGIVRAGKGERRWRPPAAETCGRRCHRCRVRSRPNHPRARSGADGLARMTKDESQMTNSGGARNRIGHFGIRF
jgi:hypothetical protein